MEEESGNKTKFKFSYLILRNKMKKYHKMFYIF